MDIMCVWGGENHIENVIEFEHENGPNMKEKIELSHDFLSIE